MQIQNNTPFVLVFGKAAIEPSSVGTLPPEFEQHPEVDLLLRLRKIKPHGGTPPKPQPASTVHTSDLDPSNDGPEALTFDSDEVDIPIGWDEFHGNKARAWIKKCDDVVLLSKMHAIEDRPKIRVALQARIQELE